MAQVDLALGLVCFCKRLEVPLRTQFTLGGAIFIQMFDLILFFLVFYCSYYTIAVLLCIVNDHLTVTNSLDIII